MTKTPKLLFFSRGSASRGHIAEGFLRDLAGDRFIPFSAGADSTEVNPVAAEVMREVGIDIASQKPHEVRSLFGETFQYVVLMGDEPRERYPVYPFARKIVKWAVPDPETAAAGPEEKRLRFRQVRDQMRKSVGELVEAIQHAEGIVIPKAA